MIKLKALTPANTHGDWGIDTPTKGVGADAKNECNIDCLSNLWRMPVDGDESVYR